MTTQHWHEQSNRAAQGAWIPVDVYSRAHADMVLACVDVVCLGVDGRLYFVVRGDQPAKGLLWIPGGRLRRGMDTAADAAMKVKEEIGYDVMGRPVFLGVARTGLAGDPFGHGKGTDSVDLVYFARLAPGIGPLGKDDQGKPKILPSPAGEQGDASMERRELRIRAVTKDEWTTKLEATAHPYIATAVRWARETGGLW